MIIKKTNKCPFCKKKFEELLYDGETWNADFLFHTKETHGYSPEIFFGMLKTINNRL